MPTDEYTALMARYELLMSDWMERVQSRIPGLEFYSAGAILDKRGGLRMRAQDCTTGLVLWETTIAPGDTQVRITFPDKTSYLV